MIVFLAFLTLFLGILAMKAGLVAAGCGYIACSVFFLKNPHHIHGRRKSGFPHFIHISHRGGAGEAYENTMHAFNRSSEVTDMMEVDCHMTSDGVVVISHDPNLKRTCGLDIQLAEVKFDDLPIVSRILPLDFSPGRCFEGDENDPEEWRRITTLEELFQRHPKLGVNIDIKQPSDSLIKAVSGLVEKYDRHQRTVWGNFRSKTTDECGRVNPRIGLLFSFKRVIQTLILFYTGLLPFFPIRETHLEIPMPSIFQKRVEFNELGTSSMGKARSVVVTIMDKILMRPSLFDHLKARGIQVYVWVLNEDEEFEKAFSQGVTGVMTDYPTKLAEFLRRNPQYRRRTQ